MMMNEDELAIDYYSPFSFYHFYCDCRCYDEHNNDDDNDKERGPPRKQNFLQINSSIVATIP
eukprot:1601533-Amphidinium_carterae.1